MEQPIYATIGAGVVNTVFTVVSVGGLGVLLAPPPQALVLMGVLLCVCCSSSWWRRLGDGRCTCWDWEGWQSARWS